jgi:hypothetical protein
MLMLVLVPSSIPHPANFYSCMTPGLKIHVRKEHRCPAPVLEGEEGRAHLQDLY